MLVVVLTTCVKLKFSNNKCKNYFNLNVNILNQIEKGNTFKNTANEFGVDRATRRKIKQNSKKIKSLFENSISLLKKKLFKRLPRTNYFW